MFFDDRLSTVLRQDGANDPAKRTQFRQLLDILGNRKFGPVDRQNASLVAAAWLRMDALGLSLPASDRAAMIREPSWRFRSADLAAHLADFEPEVASAALNRAQLSTQDWLALIPRLPVRARGFLRLRRDLPGEVVELLDQLGVSDRGLPSPAPADAPPSAATAFPLPPLPEAHIAQPDNAPFELEDAAIVADDETPPGHTGDDARPAAPDPVETGRSEISALVERIAQFRRNRESTDYDALTDTERSPRLPLGEVEHVNQRKVSTFGFATDAAGRIEWADAETAPMVIGTLLVTRPVLGEDADRTAMDRAFAQRQPIVQCHAELAGAPAISGEWIVDAQPRFTLEGHFTGYVGRFRRLAPGHGDAPDERAQEADRIRQLLHELRTPVTAVQGFAEVIQQQLFGSAPHEYRALAASIASDAAHILAGFEELDRLARLETGLATMQAGETDLGALLRQTIAQLTQVLAPRMAGIAIDIPAGQTFRAPIDPEEGELLIWRFLATLGGGCGAGEMLAAKLETAPGGRTGTQAASARITCELPRQLLEEEDIFTARAQPVGSTINTGLFGAGFALRLVRAEARAAGGGLTHDDGRVTLTIPLIERLSHAPPLTAP